MRKSHQPGKPGQVAPGEPHLGPRDEVKFVITDRADYEWARSMVLEHRLRERCGDVLFAPVFAGLWSLLGRRGLRVRTGFALFRLSLLFQPFRDALAQPLHH